MHRLSFLQEDQNMEIFDHFQNFQTVLIVHYHGQNIRVNFFSTGSRRDRSQRGRHLENFAGKRLAPIIQQAPRVRPNTQCAMSHSIVKVIQYLEVSHPIFGSGQSSVSATQFGQPFQSEPSNIGSEPSSLKVSHSIVSHPICESFSLESHSIQ